VTIGRRFPSLPSGVSNASRRFLGGRIDRNLTSESIERLVDEQVAEFDQLDFKREMYKSDPAGEQNWRRTSRRSLTTPVAS
jgi:hypothetical protein